MKRTGICLVACLALGFAVSASAHNVNVQSEAVIDYGTGGCAPSNCFAGGVWSSKKACEPSRTARVFRREEGSDTFVDSARTDGDGIWQFVHEGAQGRYYAKVLRRNIGTGTHRHICTGAESSTIRIP